MSIQIIQPSPQNTSNFYLANIQNAFAQPNSNLTFPSPPPFSPPTYGIWVNTLWFLSLVINLTCAILASLLQQWARRYLEVTQTRSSYSLHKQARTRTFFAEGIKRFRVPWVFEALPALLHLSVFLFFAGLVVYLWHINLTTFKLATAWVAMCTALYGCVTVIPLFHHDSPYHTPLTPLVRSSVPVILNVVAVLHVGSCYLATMLSCYSGRIDLAWIVTYPYELLANIRDMILMTPEEASLRISSKIDTQAFMWTFDGLDEDKDLDHFFTGLPGFFNSNVVKEPLHNLGSHKKRKLLDAIIRLLDRTYSSSLSVKDKSHKADIYINAINQVVAPEAFQDVLLSLASKDGSGPVQSADVLDFVRRWGTHMDVYNAPLIKAIFSIVVATVPQHDGSWFALASAEMEESKDVLTRYHADRNSLSLAILIHITRQHFTHIREQSWPSQAISDILREASKFDVEDTSPELQHKFCALWNEVVDATTRTYQENRQKDIRQLILRPIHEVFTKLHPIDDARGADDARRNDAPRRVDDARRAYAPRRGLSIHLGDTSGNTPQYLSCRIPGHHSEPTSHAPGPVISTSSPLSVSASLPSATGHPSDQPSSSYDPNHNDPLPAGPLPSSPARVLSSDRLIPRCQIRPLLVLRGPPLDLIWVLLLNTIPVVCRSQAYEGK